MSTGEASFATEQQDAFRQELARLKEGPEIQTQPGANRVRLLPRYGKDGKRERLFWIPIVVHWKIGPKNRLVRCLRPEGKVCFICEHVEQLATAGHGDEANQKKASDRFLMGAIPLDAQDKTPKILPTGQQVLGGILEYATQEAWGDPSDLQNGYAVTINKQGQGKGTSYSVVPDRDRMPLPDDWLSVLPDLESRNPILSYEQQQAIMAGQDPNTVTQPATVPPQQQAQPQGVVPPASEAPQTPPTPAQTPPPQIGTPVQLTPPVVTTEGKAQVQPPPPPGSDFNPAPPPPTG